MSFRQIRPGWRLASVKSIYAASLALLLIPSGAFAQATGTFTVTKQVAGAIDGYVADSTFTMTVDCEEQVVIEITNPQSASTANATPMATTPLPGYPTTIQLPNGFSAGFGSLPIEPPLGPTVCTVTEDTSNLPATANASYVYSTTPAYSPGQQVTVSTTSSGQTVTVTNTLIQNTGSLVVNKVLTGATVGYVAGSTFPLIVDCKIGSNEVSGFPQTVSVAGNASQTLNDIPATSTCSVTEGTPLPATTGPNYGYNVNSAPTYSAPATIAQGATATLSVTNTVDPITSPPKSAPTLQRWGLVVLGLLFVVWTAQAMRRNRGISGEH